MAQVTESIRARADLILASTLYEWDRLPQVAAELESWDEMDQLDYLEEWGPRELLRAELEEYARDGLLTGEQALRFQQLQRLVRARRPLLDRLLGL